MFDSKLTKFYIKITDNLVETFKNYDKNCKFCNNFSICTINNMYPKDWINSNGHIFNFKKNVSDIENIDCIIKQNDEFYYFLTTKHNEKTNKFHGENWRINFMNFEKMEFDGSGSENPINLICDPGELKFDYVYYEQIGFKGESFNYIYNLEDNRSKIKTCLIISLCKFFKDEEMKTDIFYCCVPKIKLLVPKNYSDFLNPYLDFEYLLAKVNGKFNIYFQDNVFYDNVLDFYVDEIKDKKEKYFMDLLVIHKKYSVIAYNHCYNKTEQETINGFSIYINRIISLFYKKYMLLISGLYDSPDDFTEV